MGNNKELEYPRANSFRDHTPKGDQQDRYQALRVAGQQLAVLIDLSTPKSREQALAITNLEQALMWANKAIAVNEVEE